MADDTHGSLTWGLKKSFREYVSGISDRNIALDGVEEATEGSFTFPISDGTSTSEDTTFSAMGTLIVRAHRGMLLVRIQDPHVTLSGSAGSLSAITRPTGERQQLCRLDVKVREAGALILRAELADDGAPLFGDIYPPGTVMDDVTLRLPREKR